MLLSVHSMGAMILQTPELELDEDEAKKLSDAINNVAQFYPMGLSPKMMAWANLMMVAGGIYGTRAIVVIKKGKDRRKAANAANRPVPINSPVAQPSPVATPVTSPGVKPNGAAVKSAILTPSQAFGINSADLQD